MASPNAQQVAWAAPVFRDTVWQAAQGIGSHGSAQAQADRGDVLLGSREGAKQELRRVCRERRDKAREGCVGARVILGHDGLLGMPKASLKWSTMVLLATKAGSATSAHLWRPASLGQEDLR